MLLHFTLNPEERVQFAATWNVRDVCSAYEKLVGDRSGR